MTTRRARVRALAKINLDLRVLGKRPDGYHELRTIFQTVSLADTLDISFTPGRKTAIELRDSQDIPDNLALRAARLVLDATKVTGRVEIALTKRIPMGAGLGGGSSDAAAVLLALPVLTGRAAPPAELCRMAEQLGSDISFFLVGGTAAGIGRGTEVFPLPDVPARAGILVAPGIHVSTAQAYRDLSPRLTIELQQNKIVSFQLDSWRVAGGAAANDFEAVVFEREPRLGALKRRLERAGASPALMTGSGSALFGLFRDAREADRARERFADERTFRISLVSRARYRGMWWRALSPHIEPKVWPPRSRYAR
ncbi:MAG TPA: 4-(cytidine 5'-diphospho)-2-C-methyl-D-erythritol kinase [Bryobacteraceae bacterium]|jgi:4-diphosphocytidyl-2-C-methyl-D-erythritol kinase|nr:4-(cytidine 5'-diphospho)-2-C-methyl-D-erythritol kinase [Bryobacteraceae bacterium]